MMNSPFMQASPDACPVHSGREGTPGNAFASFTKPLLRSPAPEETEIGLAFVENGSDPNQVWAQYAQVLLSSHEFMQIQ